MLPGAEPIVWRSTGSGTFTVVPGERQTRGTEVVLHLKEDEREYLKVWRVRDIIKKYSDFVQFPIYVNDELVNRSSAIWALPKSQVSEEQHIEFFRRITGFDTQTPLLRVHLSVDAPVQFHALLYVPEKAPLDLFSKERRGLRLYAKRVLIVEDSDKLAPVYLRFLRGVVDSEDLPLNVSREILQEDKNLAQIQQQLTRAVLRAIKELSETDEERYLKLWAEFGRVLKEGVAVDFRYKDEIAELCRFESKKTDPGKLISLKQYVSAMPPEQKEIYFITGPNRKALESGPHIEAVTKRGYDVLLLTDPVDEWLVQSLHEFDKRKLKSVAHGDVDLGDASEPKGEEEVSAAISAVKAVLGERVKDVRASRRLTDSAVCLVAEEGEIGVNMQRIMKMLDMKAEDSARILELNPSHPIIQNLNVMAATEPQGERVRLWSELLFDQAQLAEGVVRDPVELVKRMQQLLAEATTAALEKRT
jgi:molecular chaperone HtpG